MNDYIEAFIIFENNLEMTLCQLIRARCRGVIAAG